MVFLKINFCTYYYFMALQINTVFQPCRNYKALSAFCCVIDLFFAFPIPCVSTESLVAFLLAICRLYIPPREQIRTVARLFVPYSLTAFWLVKILSFIRWCIVTRWVCLRSLRTTRSPGLREQIEPEILYRRAAAGGVEIEESFFMCIFARMILRFRWRWR